MSPTALPEPEAEADRDPFGIAVALELRDGCGESQLAEVASSIVASIELGALACACVGVGAGVGAGADCGANDGGAIAADKYEWKGSDDVCGHITPSFWRDGC